MRRLLLSLGLATACAASALATSYNYLTLVTTTTSKDFALTNVRRITFENNQLVVTTIDGTATATDLASLSAISFTETATAIRSANALSNQLRLQDGQIEAEGQGMLLVYTTNGQLVLQQPIRGIRTQVNLGFLPRGIYIAKLGQQTLKLIR